MCGFGGEINCMVKAQSNIPKAEVYLRYLSMPQSWVEIDPTEYMCFHYESGRNWVILSLPVTKNSSLSNIWL